VERIMRDWSGPEWAATPEFAEAVRRNRSAMQVPGVAHSALEYYRWALRSQLRADGRRFASELSRTIEAPVLQVHGALDPCLLESTARPSHRWAASHEYRVLERCGHFPHQEAPDETTSLIAGFLRS